MKLLITAITLAVTGSFAEPLWAEPSQSYIEASIENAATEAGVPYLLLKAICSAESNLKPSAYVYADGGQSNHAFGMCQVLRRTAEEMGMKDQKCANSFIHSERSYSGCALFGPFTNALFAAKYLRLQLDRYEGSWIAAIAAYNSGSLKTCQAKGYYKTKTGQNVSCIPEAPVNQRYVDRVLVFFYAYQQKLNK